MGTSKLELHPGGGRAPARITGLQDYGLLSGTNFRWSVYYENESLGDPSIT